MDKHTSRRYNKIKSFLEDDNFNGFTKDHLFIMTFIKKGWGQDIAALSNMAEALVNISIKHRDKNHETIKLIDTVVKRAIHPNVNPYKKNILKVEKLGKYGYYLEHLNIILGCYKKITSFDTYKSLNTIISYHLVNMSMKYKNCHADLLPYVNMKWSADQAAIIYSIWLYDQNYNETLSNEIISKWIIYMENYSIDKKTGLYKTEVLGTRKYSNHPRGCAMAYLLHYMGKFKPELAKSKWAIFKKHMKKKSFGLTGFREYLDTYKGRWTPDSGPIIKGVGVAASGLAMNTASTLGDRKTFEELNNSVSKFTNSFSNFEKFISSIPLTKIGTDLLATSIHLNAETKINWFEKNINYKI
tara:strand:+ start:733 stop:1803 length:1071 start_codon:yes stop_codon:yes gene_type:complete